MTNQENKEMNFLLKSFLKVLTALIIFCLVGYLILNYDLIIYFVVVLLIVTNCRLYYKNKILEYDNEELYNDNCRLIERDYEKFLTTK